MNKTKLNYRFHNPNTPEVTAEYLTKLFIEVNAGKVERAIQAAADQAAKKKPICDRLAENQKKVDDYKRAAAGKSRAPANLGGIEP